jgi:hypothetical protein
VKRLHECHKVALLETLGRGLKALRRLPDVSQGTLHPQVPKLCPIEGEDLHGQLLEAPDLPYRNESLYHHPGLAVEGAHNPQDSCGIYRGPVRPETLEDLPQHLLAGGPLGQGGAG